MKKAFCRLVALLLVVMLIPSVNSFNFSTPQIFSSVLKQRIADTEKTVSELKQPLASAPTILYDRTAVAAYADKFWDVYNPSYNDYSGSGGDCANFVSQCMIAGGLSLWQGYDGNGAGVDSKGAMPFCDYLHQNLVSYQGATWDYIEWSGSAPSWLSPGDVIIYGDASNETAPDYWRHAVIIVEGYGGDAKISAHTTDRYHVAWTYAFPSSFHRTNFYHLPNGTISEYTQFKVNASAVNVRIGPGIQPPYDTPIGQITLDQKYIAYEYVLNATGKKWWHFWFDNKSAWGSADYTTVINESIKFKVDTADLNVRAGPGASYPTVGNVFNGQTFTAFESTTNGTLDWYRFWYQGRNDTWCCANYTVLLEAKSLAGYKICVDPGHGGTDPGAMGPTGYKESDANLDIGIRLRDLLVADGATVYMTRATDATVSLADRVALANNNNCNIFCSNHNNAYDGTAQGTETYYHSSLPSDPSASNSGRLATYVQNELIAHLGRTNRGVKQADFYVLRETAMPAELTEVMFIDNPTEEALLKDPNVRQDAAMSIYHGICSYFGITPTLKTDLLVDSAGNNVYGTASDGAGGTSTKSVSGGNTGYFTITLQNDGNVSDIFNINIPTTPSSWTVKLYESDNATQITTFPWTTQIISSGSTYTMYLHVTAPASPSAGNYDTIVGATSVGDSAKVDSITARANVSGIVSDKVAIWHFNEGSGQTAYDAGGNNNVATLGSSPSADANDTTWYNGIAGYGMKFNENDFMYTLNSPSLQTSGDLTIKAWLYPTNISKGRQGIISKHYSYEYDIIMEDGSIGCPRGQISFYHGNGTYEEIQEPSGMVVSENQWNYIAISRNMTDKTIRFYLNGKFVGADDFVAAPVASTYNISIGWRKGTGNYFNGIIDEIEIYNRVLTGDEIAAAQEMRALWAARWDITSATNIDNLITTCKNSNINTIFFQARGEGYALYNSTIDPKYPSVATGFDPLSYVIEKAHQNGLEVHAWINFYNSGLSGVTYPSNHVLTLHPEWRAVDKYGSSGTGDIYLCPGNLGVQNYLYNISIEIVKKYDVDGIHYDYVRYQNSSFCYCDVCKERFKAEYGYYPPTTGSDENWNNWRKAQITAMVDKIYLDAKTLKPYLGVGAAVWGVYAYGLDYFQDSHLWLSKGILDYIAPMTYYTDNALFNSSIQDHVNNSCGKHICAGIGVYKFVPDNKTQMVNQIYYAKNLGAQGIALFSYASLRDYPSFADALVSSGGAESQDNSSTSVGVRLEVTSYHRAQRFIPSKAILTKVELPINSTVSTATATVAVRGDDGGSPSKPTGAPLTSTTVTLTTTTGPAWVTVNLDDITITAGKTYWLCVSWDGVNTISWYGSTDYDSDPAYSTDGGSTWTTSTWNGVYGYKTYTKEAGGPFNATAVPPALPLVSVILSLSTGWNFISLPIKNASYSRAGDLAFAIPNCTKIAEWDVTNQSFVTYTTSSPSENNFTIENGYGYWVWVSAQTGFRTNGTLTTSISISLSAGWNSIGWLNSTINAESLAQKISNCISIAYWDSTLGRFVVHPASTNISNFMIERGRGYLVYVTGVSVWTQE